MGTFCSKYTFFAGIFSKTLLFEDHISSKITPLHGGIFIPKTTDSRPQMLSEKIQKTEAKIKKKAISCPFYFFGNQTFFEKISKKREHFLENIYLQTDYPYPPFINENLKFIPDALH